MDLTDFLLARIAEDEKTARAAEGHRTFDGTGIVVGRRESVTLPSTVAAHIARHDPARVLADCAAKRAIVELHRPEERVTGYRGNEHIREWQCPSCGGAGPDEDAGGNLFLDIWHDRAPCDTLLALAQPFAGHPDFDPAWRAG